MRTIVIISLILHCVTSMEKSCTNSRVYSIKTKNEKDITTLKHLKRNMEELDFWTDSTNVGSSVDIMVPPKLRKLFLKYLDFNKINYRLKIPNVQDLIDRDSQQRYRYRSITSFGWNRYNTLQEIYAWMDSLSREYPKIVRIFHTGVTYENRNVTGIKISFNSNNEKRSVFIESNIHAREWITNAATTYIINEILRREDTYFKNLVRSFDWYIIPVTNPDGYDYSHSSGKNRLWRKNRSPTSSRSCYGIDLNRNWDFKWNTIDKTYSPCSNVYPGPKEFSENESRGVSQFISKIANNLLVYISVHSYSQLLMVPYGYTTQKLDNYNVTVPLAEEAVKALSKRYGTVYKVGNTAETLYETSGDSISWVKGIHKIPYVYIYELRDKGEEGFLLSADKIIPTALETLDSLIVILEGALKNPKGT